MDASTVEEDHCWEQAFQVANAELAMGGPDGGTILPADLIDAKRSFRGFQLLLQVAREACAERSGASKPHIARVRRALESINAHAPILDVIAQQQQIAAFIWGSLRFILKVTAAVLAASHEISQSLSKIIRNIPRYLLELREHSCSSRVVEATSQVLGRVIIYLVKSKRFLQQSKWTRVPKAAFSTKLSRILADLEEQDRVLDLEIRAASAEKQSVLKKGQDDLMTLVKTGVFGLGGIRVNAKSASNTSAMVWSKVKQMEEKSVEERRQGRAIIDLESIAEWALRGSPGIPNGSTILPGTHGTFAWISTSEPFIKWEESGCHGCLWIQGIAGCGKTTLAKHLTEIAKTDIVLRHFFCESDRCIRPATSQFAVSILTYISQMPSLKQDPRLPSIVGKVLPLTRTCTSGLECRSERLLDALDHILDIFSNYTLIVDALDECAEAEDRDPDDFSQLLRFFRKIGSRPKTRIILLSRTGTFPEDVYSDTIRLSMTESVVNPDILRFVEQEIEKNCHKNPELRICKAEIMSKVSESCRGMFLLAKFMMDNLRKATNTNELKQRLKEFPTQVNDFYQRELDAVSRNLTNNEKSTRLFIFYALVAAYEPLTVETIDAILALNTESDSIDEGDISGNPVTKVLRLCRGFVSVVQDRVQFVHASAKDFLLNFVLTVGDSDEFLARKCLSQLSERKYRLFNFPARLLRRNLLPNGIFGQDVEPWVEEPAFYYYSCLHWWEHVTALKSLPIDILTKLVQFLVGNEFVSWSETLFQLKPNTGISMQIQIKTILAEWYERLPPETQEKFPIEDFFVRAHESLSNIFAEKGDDKLLPYLPLVRLGQYFNVGGRTDADFRRAYEYKMTVAAGFEKDLGPRNPLTLRAKAEVLKELFFQKRFDEAALGLKDIAKIQHEVTGEDTPDYFITLQLYGLALLCVTKFEEAGLILTKAASGFRKLLGNEDFNTLASGLYKGHALAREAKLDDASEVYQDALKLWLPIGGSDHPFSLMLKTALGSVYRQLQRFEKSEEFLLESLTGRKRLFSKDNLTYIDSALQLAALYYDSGRGKEAIESLGFISSSDTLKVEFERQCQATHIRALVDIRKDHDKRAKAALQSLLNKVSGAGRDKNNRETLWVRITLADLLRRCGEDDVALMVFSDLVTSRADEPSSLQNDAQEAGEYIFPLSLADEPETPAQLAIAEKALRLVKDARIEEADRLLRAKGLKWVRGKDFWVLQGGPITDTASISGLRD